MSTERIVVTGYLGCIGAWVTKRLLNSRAEVVGFDLGTDDTRLRLILTEEERAALDRVTGDITDPASVRAVIEGATGVIHLAALQIPLVRADPVSGARVNVVGTVNVFEAARHHGLDHVTYASSVAVYGPPTEGSPRVLPPSHPRNPNTLYGVFKLANEGTAHVYWQEYGLASTALVPHTVYGPGRDQGLTSQPTTAILAATRGQPYRIGYGGAAALQYAPDVAQTFIDVAHRPTASAATYALGGDIVSIRAFADEVNAVAGADLVDCDDEPLALPDGTDDRPLQKLLGRPAHTPLRQGIEETFDWFVAAAARGSTLPSTG